MRSLLLSCLAFLGVALPGSALGLLWPSMERSFDAPVGALGALLVLGTAASVIASAAVGRALHRLTMGPVVAFGVAAVALALGAEALAPSLLVVLAGSAVFGLGSGAVETALNAHAAHHFGPRDITWMHASYGLGATIGPLLAAALLSDGVSWRGVYGGAAGLLAVLACVFLPTRRAWEQARPGVSVPSARPGAGSAGAGARGARRDAGSARQSADSLSPAAATGRRKQSAAAVLGVLSFAAVETGIESGAGIWGYVFLTSGRGLSHASAAAAVSAYWAMMFAGRVVLGPVAERAGAARVLAGAVMTVAIGAALMAWPGSGPGSGSAVTAVLGMLVLGFASAPIFPLLAITQARRADAAGLAGSTQAVGLQVAASAIGSSALPAAMGVAIGAFRAGVFAPSLLVLALAMCCLYGLLARMTGRSSR